MPTVMNIVRNQDDSWCLKVPATDDAFYRIISTYDSSTNKIGTEARHLLDVPYIDRVAMHSFSEPAKLKGIDNSETITMVRTYSLKKYDHVTFYNLLCLFKYAHATNTASDTGFNEFAKKYGIDDSIRENTVGLVDAMFTAEPEKFQPAYDNFFRFIINCGLESDKIHSSTVTGRLEHLLSNTRDLKSLTSFVTNFATAAADTLNCASVSEFGQPCHRGFMGEEHFQAYKSGLFDLIQFVETKYIEILRERDGHLAANVDTIQTLQHLLITIGNGCTHESFKKELYAKFVAAASRSELELKMSGATTPFEEQLAKTTEPSALLSAAVIELERRNTETVALREQLAALAATTAQPKPAHLPTIY